MTEKGSVACPFSFIPYSIDTLANLPAGEAVYAAYRFEIGSDVGGYETVDHASALRLCKFPDAPHIPAHLLCGYALLVEAIQIVMKKTRNAAKGPIIGFRHKTPLGQNHGHLALEMHKT